MLRLYHVIMDIDKKGVINMLSNNTWFRIVIGVVLVGYMAFVFYQSVKGALAYKREFEKFKESHKHYESYVDGSWWVIVMVIMAVLGFVLMFLAQNMTTDVSQVYYYRLAYGCIGLVFLGLALDSYVNRRAYLTEDGFFFSDKYYRYRMVASFEFKNGILAKNCRVLMSNRDEITVTKKLGQTLEQKQKEYKKAKKERRK